MRVRRVVMMDKPVEKDGRFAALMRSVQAGDRTAYVRLLGELTPLLRRAIRRRSPLALTPEDAEDVLQEVLLSLHVARATYDPDRPFLPWIMAIVHNRLVDGTRRRMRRDRNEVAVERPPETFSPDGANTWEEGYGDPEALRCALDGLPRGQREAIELVKLRELTLKEASSASGMSIGALKVAVHRGMKALRVTLRKEA